MSVFGPRYVKTVDIKHQYQKLGKITWIDEIMKKSRGSAIKLHDQIHIEILINANMDICI